MPWIPGPHADDPDDGGTYVNTDDMMSVSDIIDAPPNRGDYSRDRDYLDAVRAYNKSSPEPHRIKTGKRKTLRKQWLEESRQARHAARLAPSLSALTSPEVTASPIGHEGREAIARAKANSRAGKRRRTRRKKLRRTRRK